MSDLLGADPAQLDGQASEFLRELAGADIPVEEMEQMMRQMQRRARMFLMEYRFGLDEISTKVSILRDQFDLTEDHSPIEHMKTRMKSLESLAAKARSRGLPADFEVVRENIYDIAGMRITCPYVADTYLVAETLQGQADLTVLEKKDYIANPKPNGYRSLHLIVEVPVFLAERTVQVPVEIQLRTIAMDFWASAEHELRYKFSGSVPQELSDTMGRIAGTATELDRQMADLRQALES